MKITRNKANQTFKEITKNNDTVKSINIGRTMKKTTLIYDDWEYTIIFNNNVIVKIEEYNHRELIEVYVS